MEPLSRTQNDPRWADELNAAGVQALLDLIGEATPDQKPSGGPERDVDESYLGRARP